MINLIFISPLINTIKYLGQVQHLGLSYQSFPLQIPMTQESNGVELAELA